MNDFLFWRLLSRPSEVGFGLWLRSIVVVETWFVRLLGKLITSDGHLTLTEVLLSFNRFNRGEMNQGMTSRVFNTHY